ncbi:MAG: class I SAM-dependent methyltransferase, partial [Isosphaeraceae bacterium]
MEPLDAELTEILKRAESDPGLSEARAQYRSLGIQSWLTEPQQALLFWLGAFLPGDGRLVEVGSFQGGSACFLAAGLKRRGHGRLTCIDPFLGAPPWLGAGPHQHTLKIFRKTIDSSGVADWVEPRVGDSAAIAAVWPGQLVDAVFIDGDHSFEGALKDFEAWLPKVKPGGMILLDNTIDCPGVTRLDEMVRTLDSVKFLGSLGPSGLVAYVRTDFPAWESLEQLSRACAERGHFRPWDMNRLHEVGLPPHYLRSRTWPAGSELDEPYQLAFLARCRAGDFGYTRRSDPQDRRVIRALWKDRGEGNLVELGGFADRCRTLFSDPGPRFGVILCH